MSTGYICDSTTSSGTGFNLLRGATITATGMSTTNITRLYNRVKAEAAQASTNTSISIVMDFGAAVNIDTIALLGHNFTSSVTLQIEADDESTFTSPPVDVSPSYNEDQVIYNWSSDQSYRYWRISISDSTNTSYPWIGELVIGKLLAFTHAVTWGVGENINYNVVNHETDFGVAWNYFRTKTREYTALNFKQRPDAELSEFKTMLSRSKGSFYPVLMMLDTDSPNDSIFGHLNNDLGIKFVFIDWNDVDGLTIKEQPAAKSLLIV